MQRGIKFHSWVVLLAGLLLVSCTGKASFSGSEEKAGTGIQPIRTEVPERATGQTHVLGLTAPKLDTVRVGFIGYRFDARFLEDVRTENTCLPLWFHTTQF